MRNTNLLNEIKGLLGLSEEDLASLFGEDSSTIRAWLDEGIPREVRSRIAPIAYTAQFMKEWFVEAQIPTLIRQPVKELGDCTVLELLAKDPERVISYLSRLFRFL